VPDPSRRWRELSASPGVVLLDGFHALKHALRFGGRVLLAVTGDRATALRLASSYAPDLARTLADLLVEVPPETYRELAGRAHPTGVAALAEVPAHLDAPAVADPAARRAPLVVLDNPRNLGNVGAVVRLAAGFEASGVLTLGGVDPWHPNAVRGSAGLHFALPVLAGDAGALPAGPLFALDPGGQDIRGLDIPDNALLAFGSERRGLSDGVRDRADVLVAIPMRRDVSSYNLATSVAMTLYHWLLRRPDSAR
jgi:TrmH family RNA methyltransferase